MPRLPVVSMEDLDLFPQNILKLRYPLDRRIDTTEIDEFLRQHDPIWWSRLVIAARGFLVNMQDYTEEQIFNLDDAFIEIHRVFVAKNTIPTPLRFIQNLNTLYSVPNYLEVLQRLDPSKNGYLEENPFEFEPQRSAFTQMFGSPERYQNLGVANSQKLAYDVFFRLLKLCFERFRDPNSTVRKGIKFSTDPEWQPDNRVVLFQSFGQNNRTWVLTDFDRHIISHWRPNGIQIIFGDAYLEKKHRGGFNLCDFCGMLEQAVGQFPVYQKHRFCSEQCFAYLLDGKK
ncbi:unnamed protein product [Bursaphelenchus xylophilus]|uniref:(pine wood nematode) hypothetical protein n=1 Tax=Bursaphelenchus xylophilus TaxID=6326 RepID=A0A1I7SL21_BURXY|nr:unnamed protein product [Bursaphelenchus xylophilus]CAG9129339.1 unnamed protein product [Bursaphelenchus xylophilus]